MSDIRSKPASDAYREGWERAFGGVHRSVAAEAPRVADCGPQTTEELLAALKCHRCDEMPCICREWRP